MKGILFDLFVNGHTLEDGVVFLQLQTLGGVFTVLGGDIAGGAGHAAFFVFGAFEDYLHAVALCFLCHCVRCLIEV